MSRLTVKPPEAVVIDGVNYPLNTCFRNCLSTYEALIDDELTDWEKQDILISNMYFKPYPENVNEAIRLAVDYIMQSRAAEEDKRRPVLIDFEQDGQMIYDAFISMGINLDKSDLSFYEFMAHMRELPKDCVLGRIIHLRIQRSRNKLTPEEKKECERIGWNVIKIRDRAAERENAENEEYFKNLQMRLIQERTLKNAKAGDL